jgi:transcriptional regulator with XRE-family HTH domain
MPIYVRFRGLQNLMYSENLRKIRKELDISAQKMADKLGVSQGSIAQYEAGKREPNYNFISRLNEVYNVNLNWFVSGQGEMFNGQDKTDHTKIDEAEFKKLFKQCMKDEGFI